MDPVRIGVIQEPRRDNPASSGRKSSKSKGRVRRAVLKAFSRAKSPKPEAQASLYDQAVDVVEDLRQFSHQSQAQFKKATRQIVALRDARRMPAAEKAAAYADLFEIALRSAAGVIDPKSRFSDLFLLSRVAVKVGQIKNAKLIYEFAMERFDTQTEKLGEGEKKELYQKQWDAYLDLIDAEQAPEQFIRCLKELGEMKTRTDVTQRQKAINYPVMIKEAEGYIKSSPKVSRKIFFLLSLARAIAKIGLKDVAYEKYLLAIRAYEANCRSFTEGEIAFLKEQFTIAKTEFESRIDPHSSFSNEMKKIKGLKTSSLTKVERARKTLTILQRADKFAKLRLSSKDRIISQLTVARFANKLGLFKFAREVYENAKKDFTKSQGSMSEVDIDEVYGKGLEIHSEIMSRMQPSHK